MQYISDVLDSMYCILSLALHCFNTFKSVLKILLSNSILFTYTYQVCNRVSSHSCDMFAPSSVDMFTSKTEWVNIGYYPNYWNVQNKWRKANGVTRVSRTIDIVMCCQGIYKDIVACNNILMGKREEIFLFLCFK